MQDVLFETFPRVVTRIIYSYVPRWDNLHMLCQANETVDILDVLGPRFTTDEMTELYLRGLIDSEWYDIFDYDIDGWYPDMDCWRFTF